MSHGRGGINRILLTTCEYKYRNAEKAGNGMKKPFATENYMGVKLTRLLWLASTTVVVQHMVQHLFMGDQWKNVERKNSCIWLLHGSG